ncbi:unnamed protein product [Fusarium graminearum]|uniref:Chromosome 3, complete genome n=1 Tax=Gibberella zeae (strain ATCC MYA-4620 / CBS 123657 / FGSC 9075 / NRRL 31084 / PH-1) TaxID=229533 RepID=A0A098E3Q1_GIBZE|nr:unnamed protein product [Fusarium graminearum]
MEYGYIKPCNCSRRLSRNEERASITLEAVDFYGGIGNLIYEVVICKVCAGANRAVNGFRLLKNLISVSSDYY